MAQQAQGQFCYRTVQLIKTEPLGTGSYGAVYKAMCDDLPCAGKILHPTLFQSNDPGAMTIMIRFQQECSFLSAIRHPNIVQYLGSYQDPETRLPVLLMELMDDSLTRFLERSQQLLPYHIQVNICHDVALALAYLHSNEIIHRDLSSNNVLLIGAGNRAKVTDFGMAKLFNINQSAMTPLTMCPGTLAYMSPEALDDPPIYTKKLDTFSFGVLDIQIITRQFPDPGPRNKKVRDPRFPVGEIQIPVPENERRMSHINLINSIHPLLPIATACLSYNEEDRPSAQELCQWLASLKQASQYCDSMQQAQERNRPAQNSMVDKEDRERQITKKQQEKEECNEKSQQQLQVSGQVQEKDAIIAAMQQQTQKLRQEYQQVTLEKDHVIEAREKQLLKVNDELVVSKQVTAQLQQIFLQREKMIQDLQEEIQCLRQERLDKKKTKRKQSLTWRTCKAAPHQMSRGSATVCGNKAYIRLGGSRQVHSYNSDTEEWSALPECPNECSTLTVINSLVTAVSGWLIDKHTETLTNTLLSLVASEGGNCKWVEHFPSMPTKRELTAVVCSGKTLVVAGGRDDRYTTLDAVEVMDTDTLKWSTARSLPVPLSHTLATVCGDKVYLVGGWIDGSPRNHIFTCSLSALLQSQAIEVEMKTLSLARHHTVWEVTADLPVTQSTGVTLNGQLLAVGGYDSRKQGTLQNEFTDNIYSYNTKTNSWEVISHMPTSRSNCLVAVLPNNKLMAVGGIYQVVAKSKEIRPSVETNKVEIATLQ